MWKREIKKTYIKDEGKDPFTEAKDWRFLWKSRGLPIAILAGGSLLLTTQVIYPLVFFEKAGVTAPMENTMLGLISGFGDFTFSELETQPQTPQHNNVATGFFTISIPKLNIERAKVEINASSLNPDKALGHYKGTALPGEIGNSFIYGHSVLPMFYNPKNYKTIFSTLNKLEPGDEIFVEYNGTMLTYVVEDKKVVPTKDVKPLQEVKPKFLNESTLTLMTCTPPGTRLKRLLVTATLRN